MKVWLLGSHDETWGVFTEGNTTGVYECLTKEALEFARILTPAYIEQIGDHFTGTIVEYTLDETEPLRYSNVTYNYATGEIVQSKWYSW